MLLLLRLLLLFVTFGKTKPSDRRMNKGIYFKLYVYLLLSNKIFFQSESCVYFFENIDRVSMSDYYPTNKDILYCRKATRTITEHVFEIQRVPFRFIDVGGQRSQRQKWFQCFSDITSILFMVASSEYDQVILEDRRTNRVVESKSIFETIVNNKSFVNVSIILFMNKSDLLEGRTYSSCFPSS